MTGAGSRLFFYRGDYRQVVFAGKIQQIKIERRHMETIFGSDYVRNLKTCVAPRPHNFKSEGIDGNPTAEIADTPAASPSKVKTEERHWMRNGGHYVEILNPINPDGFEFPGHLYCDVCGSFHTKQVKENLKFLWLGIGAEEHCWKCGAEPENHDPFYAQRFENWHMDFIFDEMKRVENAYTSRHIFMTQAQIEKNRIYLRAALEAMLESDLAHWPERYDFSVSLYQQSALRSWITQLAIIKYEGDCEKASNEYSNVSTHMDDLYTMLSELENNIPHSSFPYY